MGNDTASDARMGINDLGDPLMTNRSHASPAPTAFSSTRPSASPPGAAVLAAARAMAACRLVIGTTGNVSARVRDGFVITPTRMPYATMREADLVVVGLDGHPPPGASTETPLHRAAYALRDDVGGVVHTHSPYATAWGITGEPLVETEDLTYYDLGTPQTVPRLPGGSAQLAEACGAALAHSDVVLLAGHGVLAVGPDPAAALLAAEVVERQAEISWLVRAMPDGQGLARPGLRNLPRP